MYTGRSDRASTGPLSVSNTGTWNRLGTGVDAEHAAKYWLIVACLVIGDDLHLHGAQARLRGPLKPLPRVTRVDELLQVIVE